MRMDLGSKISLSEDLHLAFYSFGLGAPPVRSIGLPRPFFPFLPNPPPPPPAACSAAARVSPRLALSGGGTYPSGSGSPSLSWCCWVGMVRALRGLTDPRFVQAGKLELLGRVAQGLGAGGLALAILAKLMEPT